MMATRSTIAVQHESGRVSQIYCHWDGYLSGVGAILKEHYDTLEKAEKLIELGDLSSLGEQLEPIGEHSFREPEGFCTVAYIRDRNEGSVNCRARKFDDYDWYARQGQSQDYNYLFKDGEWWYTTNEKLRNFKKLPEFDDNE